MQLEDHGFCERADGGPFVESGAIRHDGGSLPVNTHGMVPEAIQITTDPHTEPYWQAARDERLEAPRCATCCWCRSWSSSPTRPACTWSPTWWTWTPDDVEVGMALSADFVPIAGGWKLPVFRAST